MTTEHFMSIEHPEESGKYARGVHSKIFLIAALRIPEFTCVLV